MNRAVGAAKTGMDIHHDLNARAALTLGKDMVFRDLAQGAYRMRGIARGQSITMLVIPEVAQLMKRQLAKADPPPIEGAIIPPDAPPTLQDVAIWLTINSMRSERVQFDQLCAQNLATLWRQNAWDELISGHTHFKVRPDQVQGFVHEKLGEAFHSNRLGKLSRNHLANKSIVLYFEGKAKDAKDLELLRAMTSCYSHFGCEEGLGHFEIVYVTSAETQEAFASSFRTMPWLTLPFTHALRREQLRQLFEVNEAHDTVVLLHMDGSTITRDGTWHMKLAHRCQAAIDGTTKESDYHKELTKKIAKEKKHAETLDKRVRKGVAAKLAQCTTRLVDNLRVDEFLDFLAVEADMPAELKKEIDEANKDVETAMSVITHIDAKELDALRHVQVPPDDDVRESIEAVAIMFGMKPDFATAQGKLMLRADALRERLLAYDKGQVPAMARAKLRKFLSGRSITPLAAALRQWVTSLTDYASVMAEVEMASEKSSCSPAMQSLCECLCDLHGMHEVEDDVRGALAMASRFEEEEPAAEAEEVTDQEVAKLQEKASMLKKFVTLMEVGLKEAAKAVAEAREKLRDNYDFEYEYQSVPGFLEGYTATDALKSKEPHLHQATLTLSHATILISKPSIAQPVDGRVPMDAIIAECKKSFSEMYGRINEAASDASAETVKPSPDVTDADVLDPDTIEPPTLIRTPILPSSLLRSSDLSALCLQWYKFKGLLEGVHEKVISESYLLTSWLHWCREVLAVRDSKAGLVVKRAAAKKAKEQQQAIRAQLDAAGMGAPFSFAAMHTVAQAAKDVGVALPRERLLWVLQRAKGDERVAISLATSQRSARRTLRVLRDPNQLANFDVGAVDSRMVKKVKETLKSEQMRQAIDLVEAADQAAGEKAGRKLGQRPKEGDKVLIVASKDEDGAKFIGKVGVIECDEYLSSDWT